MIHIRQKIAVVGNPNSGKSSLFNCLTGMRQKVGNFPGVTVERKSAFGRLRFTREVEFLDLPGTYGIYARRADERVTYDVLLDPMGRSGVDLYLVVIDASNLRRNLLFATQVIDIGKPVVIALTMVDIASKRGLDINVHQLSKELGVPVMSVNPRVGTGLDELDESIRDVLNGIDRPELKSFIDIEDLAPDAVQFARKILPSVSDYVRLHVLMNPDCVPQDGSEAIRVGHADDFPQLNVTRIQAADVTRRYQRIGNLLKGVVSNRLDGRNSWVERLDDILLHRVWGYLLMGVVLFLMFQAVFKIADHPMAWVESAFAWISGRMTEILPDNWLGDLVVNGIIAGVGGVLVFVPQIMILFGMITLLEDTGYMARIGFLSDRLMKSVGLNGKSVMPMISGFACAVPAIMGARNIENTKERLLTILATPLMSCSARLPVYTILISLVIPNVSVLGFLSLQGLVMLGLYILGLSFALLMSVILNIWVKAKEKSMFLLEMPTYRSPRWGNIIVTMVDKAKVFVLDAGKVILLVSIILWGLSSFGPTDKRSQIIAKNESVSKKDIHETDSLKNSMNAELLENSYAGILGKSIETLIQPLGFDWKIGIAIITSFAAREVFVGTMATLYSVGSEDGDNTLREKMSRATWADGKKVYNLATGVSLMVFYVFAMQCMSTLAVVRRETGGWKWPILMFLYMTTLAYAMSFLFFWTLDGRFTI